MEGRLSYSDFQLQRGLAAPPLRVQAQLYRAHGVHYTVSTFKVKSRQCTLYGVCLKVSSGRCPLCVVSASGSAPGGVHYAWCGGLHAASLMSVVVAALHTLHPRL